MTTPCLRFAFAGFVACGVLVSLPLVAQPPSLGDGWPVSTPAEQGVDPAAYERMVERVRTDPVFAHAYALLLVRHGTLIGETYFNGRRRDQTSDVRSVTKSVMSMTLGIARDRGRLPRSLQTPLRDLLPEYAHLLTGEKAAITLFDALTMQSGLEWGENEQPWLDHMFNHPDLAELVLSQALVAPPGEVFNYSTGLSHVLGKVVAQATGRPLVAYADEHLMRPLGIRNWEWYVHLDGAHHGGIGVQLRPRDMAKLGQLALQDGSWHGQAVVPRDWMLESTRDRTTEGEFYGFQWWGAADSSNFEAIGYGGQYIFVYRPLDVVVVLQVDWNVPFERDIPWSSFVELFNLLSAGGVLEEEPGEIVPGWTTPPRVAENEGPLRLELLRVGGDDGAVEIAYQLRAGSAQLRKDVEQARGSLTWENGDSGSRSLEIEVVDDTLEEGVETFDVVLTHLTGGAELAVDRVTVLLDDDELSPATAVAWAEESAASVAREGKTVVLRVERSTAGLLEPLEIGWSAVSVTATASDFELAEGTLTFAAGEGTATLELGVTQDGVAEPVEIAQLTLHAREAPVTVTADAGIATLAILDADEVETCQPGEALCLHEGRFRVRTAWRNPRDGSTGLSGAEALSRASGWLWFFRPGRLELMVKVLDGTGINDAHWLFFGALTDVEYFVLVEDLLAPSGSAGSARLYRNPPGSACGQVDVEAFVSRTRPSEDLASQVVSRDAPLLLDRFRIEVAWRDPRTDRTGTAEARSADGETALFWFFDESNIELAVKVIDGRAVNDRFWVFSGALTDVEFTVTVTDTLGNSTKSYENGEPLCGIADVDAFP